jgi:hypothetical protein
MALQPRSISVPRTGVVEHIDFSHWAFRELGDARARSAVAGLLATLRERGAFGLSRARLDRSCPGVRSALSINLPEPIGEGTPLAGHAGCWVIETHNRNVRLLGTRQRPAAGQVGGQLVHDVPVLDPDAPWVDLVARHCAGALLRRWGTGPLSRSAGTDPLDLLLQVEAALLRAAVHAFLGDLDTEVLEVLRREASGALSVYNHYWSQDGQPARNRRQAAQAHPWFQDTLRDHWRLRRTVDGGQPLAPVMAEHYHVPQATLRRCRVLLPTDVPKAARAPLLKCAAAFPADYLPRSADDWRAFAEVAPRLQDLAAVLQVEARTLAAPFTKGWRQGLEQLRERAGAELDPDAIFDVMQGAYFFGVRPAVADVLDEPNDDRELPSAPPASFFPLWFGRYDLPRLHAMAARWRVAYGQHAASRRLGSDARATGRLAWPPLQSAGASHGPFRIIELTSLESLEIEGERLRHCVASYAVKCLLAGSCIYSVRDRAGGSLSTFEVDISRPVPTLLRHHGPDNDEPPQAQREVVQLFVATVLGSASPAHMATVLRARRALGEPFRSRLGEPNQMPPELEPEEEAALAQAIAFAHPAEARRDGIVPFLQSRGADVLASLLGDPAERPAC